MNRISKFIKIFLLVVITSFNHVGASETTTKTSKEVIEHILEIFKTGDYENVIKELDLIQANIDKFKKSKKDMQGLVYYWKGISSLRLNEFEDGIDYLEKAISIKYDASDLFYEYGQALYISERLKDARIAFKQSVKNKFKIGVSLYYIAYISQQLRDYKKAVSFYNMIEKLPEEDSKEILQASRMQIADIYLIQVEKLPDSFTSVQKYVIPQYEKALEHDPNSKLAESIKTKIEVLQRRYDLLLFKMRNGRPTASPRYFLKANISYNIDDNVNSLDSDSLSSLDKKDYASNYTNTGFYGRYSFYPNSALSVSPELSASYTKYQSDSTNIMVNNNYYVTSGLQFNYEHMYNKAPATTYLNLDYTFKADDADADKKLKKSSQTTAITISEQLEFWTTNPTTLRYKFSQTKAEVDTSSFNTSSFIWEQLINRGSYTLFTYTSFDFLRFPSATSSNNNMITLRADLILPTAFGLFNPNFFISDTMTNYIEDSSKGITTLYTYGMSLNRPLGNKFYTTISYTIESQKGKLSTDEYRASLIGFNLDYFY